MAGKVETAPVYTISSKSIDNREVFDCLSLTVLQNDNTIRYIYSIWFDGIIKMNSDFEGSRTIYTKSQSIEKI